MFNTSKILYNYSKYFRHLRTLFELSGKNKQILDHGRWKYGTLSQKSTYTYT